jgi:hypothetical protein
LKKWPVGAAASLIEIHKSALMFPYLPFHVLSKSNNNKSNNIKHFNSIVVKESRTQQPLWTIWTKCLNVSIVSYKKQ